MSTPFSRSDRRLPQIHIVEEALREGMQIESEHIGNDDKLRLLDALVDAGLTHLMVGSFVSPRYVPQMKDIDDLISRIEPREGVTYVALALNARGVERRKAFEPSPLSPPPAQGRTQVHLCDVFVQRNAGRTQAQELESHARIIADAVEKGYTDATVAINASFGSNWLGRFDHETRMSFLRNQIEAWKAAGITPTHTWIGDPMSWNAPRAMEELLLAMQEEWPHIENYHLHLHDARGSALTTAYVAMRTLDPDKRLGLDTGLGGMGGCPYCGNGRATKMIPTEDLVDLLHEEGVDTGIDLMKLIEAAHLAEEIVGHELYGKVAKAGPRPGQPGTGELYAMDMPLVETTEQAQHFRLGPAVYEGAPYPWKSDITSAARDAVDAAATPTPVNSTGEGARA